MIRKNVQSGMLLLLALWVIITANVSAAAAAVDHIIDWKPKSDIQSWFYNTKFYMGDNLVFRYAKIHDVREVSEESFAECRMENPISVHDGGNTVVHLESPGPRYFICGKKNYCEKGLKLEVMVVTNRKTVWKKTWVKILLLAVVAVLSIGLGSLAIKFNCFNNCCNVNRVSMTSIVNGDVPVPVEIKPNDPTKLEDGKAMK